MACTKALSDFSCTTPDLPGLTNSRMMLSTFGGGTVSCAARFTVPINRNEPNNKPASFFIDADLLGREAIVKIEIQKGPDPGRQNSHPAAGRRVSECQHEVKRATEGAG